jgi:penicillin amidase
VAVLGLTAVLAGTGVWLVRRSFPQYNGVAALPGLDRPVTVYRDALGVPQVYAHNADDLFRAQGYVHAQERFWEMDFRRHVTSGRLAELFGRDQVKTDTYLRTLGWRRVAEREWDVVAPDTRRYLRAYADGVNAWLARHDGGTASLEYTVLGLQNSGYRIARWDPVDSLAWLKAMAWDLRGNMVEEIDRSELVRAGLSHEQVEQLYPAYPYERNVPIVSGGDVVAGTVAATGPSAPDRPGSRADRRFRRLEDPAVGAGGGMPDLSGISRSMRLLGPTGRGIGSNSWVLAGSRTTTGKPILANDPHLGPTVPAIWFQMGLHCDCGFNVAGYGFSGVPGIVIGHNDRVAWGFTNLGPDVTDLYLERLDGDRYEVDGQWRDLDKRTETIQVAGGRPVTVTLRATRNGPLLSDASDLDALGSAVALRWTALEPGRTMDALFALDRARDWADFRHAATMFDVPAQNMVYADVDGNIGYQSPGRIPVRGKGDGRWPAPGWDSAYQWTGYLPFAELPSVYNPAQGYVVTANQAVVPAGYPRLLTADWAYGYRSQRVNDMIRAAPGKMSVADVTRMQFDNRSGMAPSLVPVLVAADGRAADPLKGWDFQQSADSAPAALYNATWRHLLADLFDELPAAQRPDGEDRWFEVVRGLLGDAGSAWWDDRRTPGKEGRDDILRRAMREATAELTERFGADRGDWRWGAMHRFTPRNQTFGQSGVGPVEWLFNVSPVEAAGGSAIVDATGWDARVGYEVNWVPSMRMAVDLSDLDSSRWIQFLGQSGHAFSRHYDDQLDLWRTGKTVPMRWRLPTIEREAQHELRLRPAG